MLPKSNLVKCTLGVAVATAVFFAYNWREESILMAVGESNRVKSMEQHAAAHKAGDELAAAKAEEARLTALAQSVPVNAGVNAKVTAIAPVATAPSSVPAAPKAKAVPVIIPVAPVEVPLEQRQLMATESEKAAAAAALAHPEVILEIRQDIKDWKKTGMREMLASWRARYSSQDAPLFMSQALDRSRPANFRYASLLGAVHLGGASVHPTFEPFINDPNFFLRLGAAIAPRMSKDGEFPAEMMESLLHDRAMFVRQAALETAKKLRTPKLGRSLIDMLIDSRNYNRSQALPIVEQAANLAGEIADPALVSEVCALKMNFKSTDFSRVRSQLVMALTKRGPNGSDAQVTDTCE